MKNAFSAVLLFASLVAPVQAQTKIVDAVLATGEVGIDGVGRADAQFEATNNGEQRHALIAITNDINPGDTTEEAAISYQARDSAGNMRQTASISSMWPVSAAPGAGFASLRLNVDDTDGGSEIFLRGFGRSKGTTFYGTSESDYPGIPAVQFNRQSGHPSIVGKSDLVIEGGVASKGAATVFLNAYNPGNVRVGVGGGRLQLSSNTPASSSEPCAAGEIAWDTYYTYVCVATNTWKRSALSSW